MTGFLSKARLEQIRKDLANLDDIYCEYKDIFYPGVLQRDVDATDFYYGTRIRISTSNDCILVVTHGDMLRDIDNVELNGQIMSKADYAYIFQDFLCLSVDYLRNKYKENFDVLNSEVLVD